MVSALDLETLENLKASITDSVQVDIESSNRARMRFQHALYGKLSGKTPPFDYDKTTLLRLWSPFGVIHISDMPNGYFLILCASDEVKQKVLFGGPCTVSGITLRLGPWQPCFEPAYTKLAKAAVWIQLHNLLVDFWDGESLEALSEQLGRLLKVDECTEALMRTRFARVCLEIDLDKPLKRGFWLIYGDK